MKNKVIAFGICALMLLVVFSSGCIDFGGEKKEKDTTPPTIYGVTASSITDSGATITWTTNESSTSIVEYSLMAGRYQEHKTDSSYVTSHNITLTKLISNATYHFRVKSADSSGNFATSEGADVTVSISITYYKDDGTTDDDGSKLDPNFEIGVDWERDGWFTMHHSEIFYNTSEIYNPYSIISYAPTDVSFGYVQIYINDGGQARRYGIDINSEAGECEYKLAYYPGTTVNIHSNGEDDGEFVGLGGYDAEIIFTISSTSDYIFTTL